LSVPRPPSVSVVVVNFNGGELVEEAIRRVLVSSVPVEVIVVDNHSSDGSFSRLQASFGADRRGRIVASDRNLGFARANNLAFVHAKAPHILLLNPDCVVYPDTIENVMAAMEARPRIGMAGCLLLNPDGTEQAGCRRAVPTPWRTLVRVFHLDKLFPRHPRFRSFVLRGSPLPKGPVTQEAISGAFMIVRREAVEEVGLLDTGYFLHCEDLDWCMRFRQHGWEILFVPSAKAIHYKGYCSKDRPIFVLWHLHKGMVRFYRKFFRHQYPFLLMPAVVASVWLRFAVKSAVHLGRRLLKRPVPGSWLLPLAVADSAHTFDRNRAHAGRVYNFPATGSGASKICSRRERRRPS
jgi:GT2 family glycosyltransferase